MEDQGSPNFWWWAIQVVLLLGIAPSPVIAAVNNYTNTSCLRTLPHCMGDGRAHSVLNYMEPLFDMEPLRRERVSSVTPR